MTTRRAKDDSVFHQNRYASSPEFERGLIATSVAKRVSIIDDKADRELLWFLQYLSRQEGGLAAVAGDLVKKYPDGIGTRTMVEIGKAGSKIYNADEVRRIRNSLPRALRCKFPLRGEKNADIAHLSRYYASAQLTVDVDDLLPGTDNYLERQALELSEQEANDLLQAEKHPNSYPVDMFLELCRRAAKQGVDCRVALDSSESNNLEKELCRLCLDPAWNPTDGGPWYFAGLIGTLREYHKKWIEEKSSVVVTAVGKKVYDTLDYTLYSRSLSLMEGNARLGKSFAARAWCLKHPGAARFVEVPPGNDESGFLRALARGLGTGSSLNYKLGDLKEKVESVLLTGDLLLVLDEGHRLWPTNLRHCFPHRINWVMAMANAGVPICVCSTPQFIESQKAAEENGWNSAQLTGRIGHYEPLPAALDVRDLMAVGKSVLPEADSVTLRALAAYARTSARYLAAIESIAKRAKYTAQRAGRTECSADDVRTAMHESVIPSDTKLVRTLEATRKRKPGRPAAMLVPEAPAPLPEVLDGKNPRIKPACSDPTNRIAALV